MMKKRIDRWQSLALFSVLLTIYLLTFSGRFTSIDELALYAKTESLVQQGSLDTPQLNFARYHNPVGNHEPLFSIVAAPLYLLARAIPAVNNIHAVMLLNPLLVAATAAILYHLCRESGLSVKGGTVAALLFGLGSLAWPYALTFFREPLLGLCWTIVVWGIVRFERRGDRRAGAAALLAAGLTPFVKLTAVLIVPFLLLPLPTVREQIRRRLFLVVVGLVAIVAAAFLFTQLYELRLGRPFDWAVFLRADYSVVFARLYAQLLGPARGLFLFAPALLLGVVGLVPLMRVSRWYALLAAGPLVLTAASYSFYGVWYGGQVWGPRFLVPALPLLAWPAAALWDALRSGWSRFTLAGLVAAGAVWQLPIIVADWYPAYAPLSRSQRSDLDWTYIPLSPPVMSWRVWQLKESVLLWLRRDATGQWQFAPWLLLLLSLAFLTTLFLWKIRPKLMVAPIVVSIIGLLWLGAQVPSGYPPGLPDDQARQIMAWAVPPEASGKEPYSIVSVSHVFKTYFALGYQKGRFVHFWYSPNQKDDFETLLSEMQGQWLTLIVDRFHKLPENSVKDLEWWLNQVLYRGEATWVGGYELIRYARFPEEDWTWRQLQAQFGESFLVERYAVHTEQLDPGKPLGIRLEVCALDELPDYHVMFMHLLSPMGNIEGADSPVRGGQVVSLGWQPGDCIIERRTIYIPTTASPGTYELILGVETPEGRLLPQGSSHEYLSLGTIEIGSSDEWAE